ncbi:ketose-bisphosphate aldolase [Aspergillus tamarii]|uniref:Fructose-bisphosphate aldolase n=1 Tax=Aspergillus tamarii TaxID=41984 RepID=A0A5N6US82_ASPTM|nr:ketose-bisphosphate aldolase [Aspergillus tamarii]
MTRLATNKTLQILDAAENGRYGVLAAIAYNVEHITAFVRAAENRKSPLIIQLFPSALTQTPSLVYAAAAAARAASVPISLHLDHAQNYDQIKEIADTLPFDSIMVDMSHYEKEENLERTAVLREYCHARGISTEAETGRIEGGEDGIMDTGDLEGILTSPEDVEDFIRAGVDYLAPSVGNLHGDYGPKGPQPDMDRLHGIFKALNGRARLVLHGTNDFSPELSKACIQAGVSKFNVNKLVLDPWYDYIRANINKPVTQVIDEGIEVLIESMERWMDIMGSSGKA